MSGALGNLNIHLSLETVKFQKDLERSNQRTQHYAKQFQINLDKAQQKAKQFSERTTKYLNNIEKAAKNINNTTKWSFRFDNFSRIAGFANQFVKTADSYTELQNRMRLVTEGSVQLVAATESVFDIALKTNQSLNATSEVYQRFAKNAKQLGLSQADVASLTETVSKAVAMSGASAASAEAALMQFGQAMAAGELRGQELNSVMEQTPGLADAIAKGLGITTAELKAMGKSGELTIPKVIDALQKAKDSVDSDFAKRVLTVSQAFTNLETNIIKTIGELDKAGGITSSFAKSIEFAANNLDTLIKITGALVAAGGVAYIGRYANGMLSSAYSTAKNTFEHYKSVKATYESVKAKRLEMQTIQASLIEQAKLAQSERTQFALREQMKVQSQQIIALAREEAQAKRELSVANSLVSKASGILKGALGLIGGPTGAAMLAGSALFYFSMQAKEAQQKALDTAGANDRLKESYDGLSESALSLTISKQMETLENYEKQIASTKAKISEIQTTHWQFGLELSEKSKKEIELLNDELQQIKENQNIDFSVLKKQVTQLGIVFTQNGKTAEDFARKLKLIGVDSKLIDEVLAELPDKLKKMADQTQNATEAVLDLKKAQAELTKKSDDLRVKLEVLKLKNQGHAKASFVLAGLYDVLGEKGAKYSEVLNAIARGDVAAAESAAKAIKLSAEQLNTMLEMGKKLDGMFTKDQEIKVKEKTIKEQEDRNNHKKGRGENARENWLSFYDDLRQKSGSTLNEIDLEEIRMFQRLEEHMKKGVVQHQEYEAAKLAITQRFNQQRLELAGKYAPNKLAANNLDKELAAVKELQAANQLTVDEAKQAAMKLQFEYAQNVAQNAVTPLDQLRAIYDPNQAIQNQQTQELALLQAFYEQKLMTEEEFQQRKKQIIDRYKNDEFQREMNNYATGLNDLGGAFGNLASMIEQSGGRQSAAYKAMFAVSKAFAIAESMVKLSQAISQAMADPTALTPAQKFANMAAVAAAGMNVVSQISSVGFATGGYTGDGGKYTPAGIVHRGEYVITKEATARLGLGYLNYLNYGKRGFANGGGVAVPRLPSMEPRVNNSSQDITVKVINQGEPVQAEVSTKQKGDQLEITLELMKTIARNEANQVIQTNFRAGGAFS
ncbi:tape measure domain-containing protein [Pasteurella langaaensis DSM 22999]|uniref:Tape measure domain-containing protein n=1 Tax=Alitibacter langaaensis DSM 22999 TaxID=1122935 RepID=A0A2U0TA84_9PAST|nr:tape measure protein [Pasteurella langaaensis]PVX40525.1 tape measure domain-containing protein [Pasteurella langaaensis DSM 22999]